MENIVLTIDGESIVSPAGTSILAAADQHGIEIPRLCHHPDLKPFGACRLCLVSDEKTGRLMAACVTPVASGMVIQTRTPRILKHRRNIVRLMMAEHPESCVVCNKGNRCQLRSAAARLGVGETNLYPMPNTQRLEQANPFITRDLSKCILCGKCIRADHELVVVGAIDYNLRGFHSRPTTAHNLGLEKSDCTFCGTCVSICPTGALSPGRAGCVGTPERESYAICGYCGVGCRLSMGTLNNRIVDVNPAHDADSVNRATLCVRGHFAHDFLNTPRRLYGPRMRKAGDDKTPTLAPASWEDALDTVAGRLKEIKKASGPQSIAFLGSSKCTNEENYLFQKIARVCLGTNNIDNGGYMSGQGFLLALDGQTGGRWRTAPLANLEKAEAILVLGADACHSVPVASYYLKRASRKGVPLVVVDPRRTDLVKFSSLWIRGTPQSDLAILNGIAASLYKQNAYDAAFIDRYTEGFSLYRYSLSSLDLEQTRRETGVTPEDFERAAALLAGKKIAWVIGNGLYQQRNGHHALGALLNLSLLTGSLGTETAGIHVLARENNQMGAMDMGAVPGHLPGRQPLVNEAVRDTWAKAWGIKMSPDPGLNMVRIIREAEKGNLKALYIMGENPLRALPETDRVKKTLGNLEFLVVQDILRGETAEMADVVLPGAAFSEKEGTFTNLEGRIQSFSPVVSPPGNAKPDWEILDMLLAKLGDSEPYGAVEKIRKEIVRFVPMYAALEGGESGWVGASGRDDGVGMISFAPVVSAGEVSSDPDYPLTAILGSSRYHLGSGTRTGHSSRIRSLGLAGAVDITPSDAKALELAEGDAVKVLSPHGVVERRLRLNPGVGEGQVFVPTAVNANDAMDLIGLSDLTEEETPGWKTCPVRLEKVLR